MTQSEWLTSQDVRSLLMHLGAGASPRKLRLFACACAVAPGRGLVAAECRAAIGIAREYADGEADLDDLGAAADRTSRVLREPDTPQRTDTMQWRVPWPGPRDRAADLIRLSVRPVLTTDDLIRHWDWDASDAMRLRDVFGNPFVPPPFDPRWRTADVVAVARGIYTEQAYDRLPILIDALMDAGCDDPDVFAHFRRVPPHVKGCYMLDMLLGKE
jgi:hypothetical protein